MQAITELELGNLAMELPEFAADPLPHFRAAREQHPWAASCAFGYVIHGYEAIKDLLWQDDKMRTAMDTIPTMLGAGKDSAWVRMAADSIIAQTGEEHKRLRSVVTPMFTPKQANLNRELMQETINRLLDEWLPKGSFDFEEFISYYPIGVICAMLGSPREAIAEMRGPLETLGLQWSMDPNMIPALDEATQIIDDFGQQLIAERRAGKHPEKGGELLDVLIEAADNGSISERELYDLVIFLFVGGYDTSKNVITFTMYELLSRPEIYQRCAEDLSYCRKVVEESMRYHAVANVPRIVTEDIVYRDVLIPEGTMLFFAIQLSGRDPSAFGDVDTFDPDHVHKNKHLGFGRGMHICLGQFIARAQMEEGLHIIAQRIKEPKLSGAVEWRPFFGVWGLDGLPIEFTSNAAN